MTNFRLTEAEVLSAVWQKVSKGLEERLVMLRQRNDGELTPEETARLRGEIRAIKYMLEWGKPAPTISELDS